MDSRGAGVAIVVLGVVAIVVGVLVMAGWLSWFGSLPGDIRYERGQTRVFIPVTSMLIVSLGLTLAGYVLRRLM